MVKDQFGKALAVALSPSITRFGKDLNHKPDMLLKTRLLLCLVLSDRLNSLALSQDLFRSNPLTGDDSMSFGQWHSLSPESSGALLYDNWLVKRLPGLVSAPGFSPTMITKQYSTRLENVRFISLVAVVMWVHNSALQGQRPPNALEHFCLRPVALQVTNLQQAEWFAMVARKQSLHRKCEGSSRSPGRLLMHANPSFPSSA
jgi:hypothetical protein